MKKIVKLINEYQLQIDMCNKEIKRLTGELCEHRGSSSDSFIEFLSNKRQIQETKKQSYVQFQKNLEDLL